MLPLSMDKIKELHSQGISHKELKEGLTKDMPRHERKRIDREVEKFNKALKTMTPAQLKAVDVITDFKSNEKASEKIDGFRYVLDTAITSHLILENENIGWKDIVKVKDKIEEIMKDFFTKQELILKENMGDYDMAKKAIESMEVKLEGRIIDLLEEGKNQKQAIEMLVNEFNKLPKSTISQAFKAVKSEWIREKNLTVEQSKGNKSEVVPKKQMDEALDYIFNEKEPVRTAKTLGEAKQEVAEKIVEENKEVMEEVKMGSLKVKEMTLVVEGANGEYKASKDGVILVRKNAQIDFKNIEELEKWTGEVKEVFKMIGGVA